MNTPPNAPNPRKSFEELSYASHSKEYSVHIQEGYIGAHAQSWLRTDTIAYWLHYRLRNSLAPLFHSFPGSKWLTVGDGGFGNDAHFLEEQGLDVLATDISIDLLAEAVRMGHIKKFAQANAEKLSFMDEEFDFVLCKEAYHHFPRPYIALYEMLRVAKQAVVLIEPLDRWAGGAKASLARVCFDAIRWVMGKNVEKHSYEPSGNYQYCITVREMEKVALGMNYPAIAHLPINSIYRHGVETASLTERHPLASRAKRALWFKNLLSRAGLIPYGLLVVIIFKRKPSAAVFEYLSSHGFSVELLPANPYLSAARE